MMLKEPFDFWDTIPTLVGSKVRSVIGRNDRTRESVILYLRDLEAVARRESGSREAIQVIASGRRVLGDMTEIGKGMGKSFEMTWMRRG